MDAKDLAPWIAIFIAICTFVYNFFIQNKQQNDRFTTVETIVNDLKSDFDIQAKFINELHEAIPKIDLFWSFVQTQFPKMLLHDDTPERDILLIKMSNNTLTKAEALTLEAMLETDYVHLASKRDSEALINRWTLLSLKQILLKFTSDE